MFWQVRPTVPKKTYLLLAKSRYGTVTRVTDSGLKSPEKTVQPPELEGS